MKRNIILLLALMIVGSIAFICCKDSIEDELPKPQPEPEPTPVLSIPKIDTLNITEVTISSFKYEVSVTDDGGASITERGVCYGIDENPTINDTKTSDGKGTGSFSGKITGLPPDMVYYVRVYATNSKGTSYGESIIVSLIKQEILRHAEQAYPGVLGEIVTTTYNGREITCRKINGKLFYQGDILIPSSSETRGIAIKDTEKYWSNNTLVYKIDKDFPNIERIEDAIVFFSKTNIIFQERTDEENYVLFKYIPEEGCYSYVGMIGSEQEIVIDNWAESGTVAHEICHALGLKHEHQKPNADNYIKFNEDNFDEEYKSWKKDNYEEYKSFLETNIYPLKDEYGDKYYIDNEFDFYSIMLYGSLAGAKNKKSPTFTKLNGAKWDEQREYLSEQDIKMINKLYPNSSPTAPQLIFPKDNATISDLLNFTWEASTDPDNDPFVYDLYLTPSKNYAILPQYFNQINWEWKFEDISSTEYELNQSFLPYDTYYWAVLAREVKPNKAKVSHSPIYTFTLAPNAPILTSPANYSIFNKKSTSEIDIYWKSVTGTDEYWLKVFPKGKVASPIFNESIGNTTNKKININTQESGIYEIQVKARRTGGEWSKFSDSHKFIFDTPPAAPTITAPKNSISITRNTTQAFSWNKPSTEIDRYYLRIVRGTNLNSTPVYEKELSGTNQIASCTWEPGTYTWSVRAMKKTPKGFSDRDYETTISWGGYADIRTFIITEPVSVPTVITSAVTDITHTTGTSGGNVTSDGGLPVTDRGICWSVSQNPTVENSNKTKNGSGTGSFTSNITGLAIGTTYYVRSYATNSQGTAYGNQVTLKTLAELPTLTTTSLSNIAKTSVDTGGNITSDGGSYITARGVCYDTAPNPTINGNKTSNGTGVGFFASSLSGLTVGETYYIRAYATNSIGTAYGKELRFNGLTEEINEIVPEEILEEIKALGMPIHTGTNPPNITGVYNFSPVILKNSNIAEDTLGDEFNDGRIKIYDQSNTSLTAKFKMVEVTSNGEVISSSVGDEAHITHVVGNSSNFTLFVRVVGTEISGEWAELIYVYSGTMVGENINSLHFALVMLNNNGYERFIDNGQGRLFYDQDGVSERIPSLTNVVYNTRSISGVELPSTISKRKK